MCVPSINTILGSTIRLFSAFSGYAQRFPRLTLEENDCRTHSLPLQSAESPPTGYTPEPRHWRGFGQIEQPSASSGRGQFTVLRETQKKERTHG